MIIIHMVIVRTAIARKVVVLPDLLATRQQRRRVFIELRDGCFLGFMTSDAVFDARGAVYIRGLSCSGRLILDIWGT